jgi:hypothetical protein
MKAAADAFSGQIVARRRHQPPPFGSIERREHRPEAHFLC